MKHREWLKRWAALALGLCIVIGLCVPAVSATLGTVRSADPEDGGAEMTAAFDRLVYAAGDTVTVGLLVSGGTFDAVGFCLTYDPNELTYRSAQPGDGFAMPVLRAQESSLEAIAQAESPRTSQTGLAVARLTFTTVTGSVDSLQFAGGSDAYLGGKSCAVYNGYQELTVKAEIVRDAAADAALRQAKADALAALTADIQENLEGGVTVAQQDLLRRCLQWGRSAIHSADTVEAVSSALEEARSRAAAIVADASVDYPKMTALVGDELNDGVVLENFYPAFSPDKTDYFLSASRPIGGTPRALRGTTAAGVSVLFNGKPVTVAADGTFRFAIPFQALENISTLILTDPASGLSTTYRFYSCGYGVSGGFTNTVIYNEDGAVDKEHIGDMVQNGTVYQISTSTSRVKIGFAGTAKANQVFRADLVDSAGQVLQTFTAAGDDDPVTQSFLSDTVQLKAGLNWYLLRYHGVDRSRYEGGKPVETPAYKTIAILINYTDPEDADRDPTLTDTALDGIRIRVDGAEDVVVPLDSEQRKYTVTLRAEDFDLALGKQYVRMLVDAKEGQTLSVFGGSGIAQNLQLQKDGAYYIADYLDTDIPRADRFTVSLTVTAKDGQHKETYTLTIAKEGMSAMVVPGVYKDREVALVPNDPYRTWNLTFASVGLTDADGNVIPTVSAMQDGRLTMEVADPTIFDWAGTVDNGSFVIELRKQGETALKLIYDDGALHMEETVALAVNYTADALRSVLTDARDMLRDTTRKYDASALRHLEKVVDAEQDTYIKYKDADRRNLTQAQIQDINRAVTAVLDAMQELVYAEVAEEIIAFAPLDSSITYQQVPNSVSEAQLGLPKTLDVTLADGTELTLKNIKWQSDPEYKKSQEASKLYQFTPILPAGYKPARGVALPEIWVRRAEVPFTFDVRRWKLPEGCEGERLLVPLGTVTAKEIMALSMQAHVRGDAYTDAPTQWADLDGYDPNQVGQYRFQASLIENELDKETNMRFIWSDAVPADRRTKIMIVQVFDLTMNKDAFTLSAGETSAALAVDQADYPANAISVNVDNGIETVPVKDCLVWTSSDPTVATVDRSSGQITALSEGKTTVTARLYGTELTASCLVSVVSDRVTVQPKALELAVNATGQLSVEEALPRGTQVTWSSENEFVATVDEDGLVTAHNPGQSVIRAAVRLNGHDLTGTALVTVVNGGGTGGDTSGTGGGSGGTGTLSGQPTSGGDYRDLLTDPEQSGGETPNQSANANHNQTPSQTPGNDAAPNPGGETGGNGGTGTGGHRIIAVDGPKGGASAAEVLILAGVSLLLLLCGLLRGRTVHGKLRQLCKKGRGTLAILLAAAMLAGIPATAQATQMGAAEPAGYIVLSVEKLTLGQGFIMEPQRVPYYSDENLAQVMDRVFREQGRAYTYTGTFTSGFYLAELEDPDRPGVANTIPAYIYDMWSALKAANPSVKNIRDKDTEEPDFLGEYDYFSQSGWMYSVNHSFPPVGAADARPYDGMVVRWQFSLIGYGGDLGGSSSTAAGSRSFMDRTELYTVLAAVRADEGLMADAKVRPVYDRLLAVCTDIAVETSAVQDDLATLKKALGGNQITALALPEGESAQRSVPYGTTAAETAQDLPTYLQATIDGEGKLVTGVTWTVDSAFGAPGTYAFRPVLPKKYERYTITAALPQVQVTLLPPSGDVNGDENLDIRDISRMAASAGRTDRPLCDLDGSGMTTWNDFRLLVSALGTRALTATGVTDAPPMMVQFDKTSYTAGEIATACISAGGTGFDAFTIALDYDSAALDLSSVTLADSLLETARETGGGTLRLGGASLEGMAYGDIVTVSFRVQQDCAAPEDMLAPGSALLYSDDYVGASSARQIPEPTRSLTAALSVLPGDLDGSGVVDMDDAIRLVEYCNNRANLSAEELQAADVNGDGAVNLQDAAYLIQYCNGLIDALPVHRGQ